MNGKYKLDTPKEYTLLLNNFKGVDFANTPLNVAKNRAADMKNFIHRDGTNQKRYGWSEFTKAYDFINRKSRMINGFWNYTDTYGKNHTIVHADNKIFSVDFNTPTNLNNATWNDITTSLTYCPSKSTLEEWRNKVKNSITNDISYGIVRGNRLYIFCGIYLVYGTWDNGATYELRIVEDNIDTYIPTTTIGISSANSGVVSQTTLEEVNMLSSRRKNKLIGEVASYDLNSYVLPKNYFDGSTKYQNTYNGGISIVNKKFNEATDLMLEFINDDGIINKTISLETYNDFEAGYTFNGASFTEDTFPTHFWEGANIVDVGIWIIYIKIKYNEEGYLSLHLEYGANNPDIKVSVSLKGGSTYYLDTQNIDADEEVRVYNYDELIDSSKYIFDYVRGKITFKENFPPLIEGQSNIIVEFSKRNQNNFDKINNCKFGIMFGYNEEEHLFISGNDNYPNMDFHSSNRDISESQSTSISLFEDLTYFGDLSYATVGSSSTKIIGYSLLGDTTLAIHKEFSPNEASLYIRQAVLGNAIDSSGNVVLDLSGNPFQKVYYKQYASAIGEGAISTYANCNLRGDNLFLSSNGVYGIVLSSNIKSDDRYARERGRLINNKLINEPNLDKAKAISYDGKYLLAVNNKVYIADSRFMTRLDGEAEDTFSYEWWLWDNVPVRIWFIYKDNLCFGTDDGRLCMFRKEDYIDQYTIPILQGGITHDIATNSLIIEELYDETISKLKDKDSLKMISSGLVCDKIMDSTIEVEDIDDGGNIKVSFDLFYNKIRYLENKEVLIDSNVMPLYIDKYLIVKNLDYNNLTFQLWNEENKITEFDDFILVKSVSNQNVYIGNMNYEEGTFKIYDASGSEIEIYNYKNGSTPLLDIIAFFSIKENVKSYFVSPPFNLGRSDFSKNLHSATITPAEIVNGKISFGIKTRNSSYDFEVQGTRLFNFNNIDFTNFSFETSSFAKSYTKKLRIKNFNFVQFCYWNNDDSNCAVDEISFSYSLGRKNKGVR